MSPKEYLTGLARSLSTQALACEHEAQACAQSMVGFWRGKAAGYEDAAKKIESYLRGHE